MEKIDELYVMRNGVYIDGLMDLINHIKTFSNTKEMRMIEIGSYAGESTKMFAENFKEVICIDPYLNDYDKNDIACYHMDLNKVYDVFLKTTENFDNIKLIKKISDDAIEDLIGDRFDFIYIDGLHTYDQVKKDIENYRPLVKNGGFIGGHDYHPVWQGVVDAINEKLGIPDKQFVDTSWIFKL